MQYHQDMWGFHTTVTAEHPYEAHPLGWLVQARPTSFFYESPDGALCGAERCAQTVTSLGNRTRHISAAQPFNLPIQQLNPPGIFGNRAPCRNFTGAQRRANLLACAPRPLQQ